MSKPLMIDWDGLVKLGHPFSRTHTQRKEAATITVTRTLRDGRKEKRVIANPDPFPQRVKLGPHQSSPVVWNLQEVLAYYRKHGLNIE